MFFVVFWLINNISNQSESLLSPQYNISLNQNDWAMIHSLDSTRGIKNKNLKTFS